MKSDADKIFLGMQTNKTADDFRQSFNISVIGAMIGLAVYILMMVFGERFPKGQLFALAYLLPPTILSFFASSLHYVRFIDLKRIEEKTHA